MWCLFLLRYVIVVTATSAFLLLLLLFFNWLAWSAYGGAGLLQPFVLPFIQQIVTKQWSSTFKHIIIICISDTTVLQNLLWDHHPAWQLRSSSAHLLSKPAVTSTFASQAFCVSVPTVWNSLKPDLHSVDSLGSFKSQLKSTLFLAAYGSMK